MLVRRKNIKKKLLRQSRRRKRKFLKRKVYKTKLHKQMFCVNKDHFFRMIRYGLYLLTIGTLLICYENHLYDLTSVTNLTENSVESAAFRSMSLSNESITALDRLNEEDSFDLSKIITIWMLDNDYDLTNCSFSNYTIQTFEKSYANKKSRRPEQLQTLVAGYESVWEDVTYFPIPISNTNEEATVSFENSWMAERTYGGSRGHEGTDVMADINQRGYYPVVSITDGTVEKIGWLNQGGWRLGIRAPHGAYFYYAHLYDYAEEFQAGDSIQAGELIGYMGDSGYSEVEGTTGNFDVHLHVGIYIQTMNNSEMSINPYWVLYYLKDNRLTYSY